MHGSLQKENEDPTKLLGLKAYIPFYTKNEKLCGCDKTKGLWLARGSHCGTVTIKYMAGEGE